MSEIVMNMLATKLAISRGYGFCFYPPECRVALEEFFDVDCIDESAIKSEET